MTKECRKVSVVLLMMKRRESSAIATDVQRGVGMRLRGEGIQVLTIDC